MTRFEFNTGRGYENDPEHHNYLQRIVVVVSDDRVVHFRDHSRNIDGTCVEQLPGCVDPAVHHYTIQQLVMRAYDEGQVGGYRHGSTKPRNGHSNLDFQRPDYEAIDAALGQVIRNKIRS
jgi:hypothetical protein